MTRACGWDIGGVHIKGAACDDAAGAGLDWRLEPFAIWREPGELEARLAALAAELGGRDDAVHAVTMTAELSDVFPDRDTGVRVILEAARGALGGTIRVLDLDARLVSIDEAAAAPDRVAAANWMATATLAARLAPGGVLVDIGSTTTDIVPFGDGRPRPAGRTDLERLRFGELVYTGILRTPPSAICDRVPLGDGLCRVAPEHFTIMADAYVLLGRLRPADYTVETPDGRGRSPGECAARLARLVCSDPGTLGAGALRRIAGHLEERQITLVAEAISEVARRAESGRVAVVAGAGADLAAAAARRAGLEPRRLAETLPLAGDRTRPAMGAAAGGPRPPWDVAAPAVALALLAARRDA